MKDIPSHGLNLEKLQGTLGEQKTYTIRHNYASRIVLCPIATKEGQVWVVTDILPNHEYPDITPLDDMERTILMSAINQDSNNNNKSGKEEIEETEFVLSSRVEFCNKQYILLDEGQEEVRIKGKTSLPLIISGAPGSGKTSVLLAIIKQNIMHWCEERGEPPRILVIAKSAHLVHQLRREWADIYEKEFKDTPIDSKCVTFKTPEELYTLKHGATNFKGEQDFISWYRSYTAPQRKLNARENSELPLAVSEAPLIYQEFHTMSAYKSFEDYSNLVSRKFSLFPEEKTRAWLWDVYKHYEQKLKDNHEIDLAFQPIELTEHYDFIGVEETPDLSREQIKSLVERPLLEEDALTKDNLIFCVGDHQRLFGSETTLPFIRSLFWEKYQKDVTTHVQLKGSYRCPEEIIKVSNAVLQFKYQAIGSSFVDKNELAYVTTNQDLKQPGAVHWLSQEADLKPLREDRNNVHFVVITCDEFLEEAQRLFGPERVFTPTTMKGLQAKHVLLYRFLDQDGFKAANEIIGNDFELQKQPTETPKNNAGNIRHNNLFNEFFVATTRAEVSLSIYQPDDKDHKHVIRNKLKQFITDKPLQAHTQSTPTNSTKEEWLARADYLEKELGQKEQAQEIRARFVEPEKKVDEPKVTVNNETPIQATQPSTQTTQIPAQSTQVGRKKNRKQKPLHPIEEVLFDKPGILGNFIESNEARTYLFNTPLKTINETWPACSLVEYLENPEHAKIKDKLLDALKKRLEVVCQWKKPTAMQQREQDVFMGLLHYETENMPNQLATSLKKRLKPNSPSQLFIENFMQNRRAQLDEQLREGNSGAVASLHCLGLLNAFNQNGYTPMQVAVLAGKTQLLAELKKLGADISKPNAKGITPLFFAIRTSNLEVVQKLIKLGVDVNQSTDDGTTPLHMAALEGHIEIIQVLIKSGAKINKMTKKGITPLRYAVTKNNLAAIQKLIGLGADVNQVDEDGATPLHVAAQNGNLTTMKALLSSKKAEINATNKRGITPLYFAAQHGHYHIFELLIKAGAKIDEPNKKGATPMYIAAQTGHALAVRELIRLGAKSVNTEVDSFAPIHVATYEGHLETIKALLESGADVNKKTNDGSTPLHIAVQKGQLALIKILINAGAKLDEPMEDGKTPLFLAVQRGNLEAVQELIKAGAKVDEPTSSGTTPLCIAADWGRLDILQELIKAGAKVDEPKKEGKTPLFAAAGKGKIDVVSYLLETNACRFHAYQASSKSLILVAADIGPETLARAKEFITSKGQVFDSEDSLPILPHEIAHIMGHTEIEKLILDKMASSQNKTGNLFILFNNNTSKNDSKSSEISLVR
ncbi:ankyrin repeat domain-containing protein [Legionella sp. CNM-1927-20]|uniref:ankyrin repeat domain-containing protein n=1 Tax=Legionella sp. CNM-1927-20 TaxID=3422221 RepID=UPI00403AC9AE